MENKNTCSISNDVALRKFLSLEEQNCSKTFKDYEVTREYVKKSVSKSLSAFGLLPQSKSSTK